MITSNRKTNPFASFYDRIYFEHNVSCSRTTDPFVACTSGHDPSAVPEAFSQLFASQNGGRGRWSAPDYGSMGPEKLLDLLGRIVLPPGVARAIMM